MVACGNSFRWVTSFAFLLNAAYAVAQPNENLTAPDQLPEQIALDATVSTCLPWANGDLSPLELELPNFSEPQMVRGLSGADPFILMEELSVISRDPIYIAVHEDICEVVMFQRTIDGDFQEFFSQAMNRSKEQNQQFSDWLGHRNAEWVLDPVETNGILGVYFADKNGSALLNAIFIETEFDGSGAFHSSPGAKGFKFAVLKSRIFQNPPEND